MKHGIFLMSWIFSVAIAGIILINSNLVFAASDDHVHSQMAFVPYSTYYKEWMGINSRDNINDAERSDLLRALDSRYYRKFFQFVGTISKVSATGLFDITYEVRAVQNVGKVEINLVCQFNPVDKRGLYSLRVGQTRTLVGKFYGTIDARYLSLKECQVLK